MEAISLHIAMFGDIVIRRWTWFGSQPNSFKYEAFSRKASFAAILSFPANLGVIV